MNPVASEDRGIWQIDLLITHACNLNCRYCYESYKSKALMSLDTCKTALKNAFSKVEQDKEIKAFSITYLGGEPLLNSNLIKDASEWLWSKCWPVGYTLDFTTNGTLLTHEFRRWLLKNKHRIDACLSLDGLGEMQRINRTNKKNDIEFFVENWPHRPLNLVLFRDSIHLFAETVLELREKGIDISVTIGGGFEWYQKDVEEYERQLERLLPYFENDIQKARRSGVFLNIEHLYKPVRERLPFCNGEISNKICYDADGNEYGCHMMTPLVIGALNAKKLAEAQKQMQDIPIDVRCAACPLFNSCRVCPAMNLKICGNLSKHATRETSCKMMKVQARQSAILYSRFFSKCIERGEKIDDVGMDLIRKALKVLEDIPPAAYL